MIIMLYFFIPRWKRPRNVNGILERYILYISNHTHDFTVWDVIYNNTELFQDHTLQYLSPGNKYLIKLAVSLLCFYHFVCPHHSPCCFPFVSSSLHLSLKKKRNKILLYCYLHWKLASHTKWKYCWSNTYIFIFGYAKW